MRYIPLKQKEKEAMLRTVGVSSTEGLFCSIPSSVRLKQKVQIPLSKTELELRNYFHGLAEKNRPGVENEWRCFLGAGCYEHFIPSVVDNIVSRQEFLTSYTPYQPEMSQGTLQAIFEFQSFIANLFSMDVANASMYDGASATAEAVLMACRIQQKKRFYISKGIHPEYREVVLSYLQGTGIEAMDLELDSSGRTILSNIELDIAAMVVALPNFFGVIEEIEKVAKELHEKNILLIVTTTEPMAFGVLKGPGSQGADIVAGEGQSFGNPMSFGGPFVGLLATKKEFIRQLPGRIVGKTKDRQGKDGYVLTLATREQHIRREKAMSNICTNHSLCALRACVYLATLGASGLRQISCRNFSLANELRTKLLELKGVASVYEGPTFNEFVVRLPISTESFLSGMEREKILGGVPLSRWGKNVPNDLLVAVTETKTSEDIDRYVSVAKKIL